MSVVKKAKLVYCPAHPPGGIEMPAHVKIQWVDEQGRVQSRILDLPDAEVARLAELPNEETVVDLVRKFETASTSKGTYLKTQSTCSGCGKFLDIGDAHEMNCELLPGQPAVTRYGVWIRKACWITVNGGPDLCGTREEMEKLAATWTRREHEDFPGREAKIAYEARPYDGSDPGDEEEAREYLNRQLCQCQNVDTLGHLIGCHLRRKP